VAPVVFGPAVGVGRMDREMVNKRRSWGLSPKSYEKDDSFGTRNGHGDGSGAGTGYGDTDGCGEGDGSGSGYGVGYGEADGLNEDRGCLYGAINANGRGDG
jgi:hypothetical protein